MEDRYLPLSFRCGIHGRLTNHKSQHTNCEPLRLDGTLILELGKKPEVIQFSYRERRIWNLNLRERLEN